MLTSLLATLLAGSLAANVALWERARRERRRAERTRLTARTGVAAMRAAVEALRLGR